MHDLQGDIDRILDFIPFAEDEDLPRFKNILSRMVCVCVYIYIYIYIYIYVRG